MFCPSCGKEAQQGTSFCAFCGARLNAPPVQPQPPQPSIQNPTSTPLFPPTLATSNSPAVAHPTTPAPLQGAPYYYYPARHKDPGIALFLSFLIPGLGQLYNDEVAKGIGFVVLGIVFALAIFVLIGFFLYPVFWIYSMYDAYTTSKRINDEERLRSTAQRY